MAKNVIGRMDKSMWELIRKIQAKYIMEGRSPPSISKSTRIIAEIARKSDLLIGEGIYFLELKRKR